MLTNLQLSQDNRKTPLQGISKTNDSAFPDILLELHLLVRADFPVN